MNNPTHPAGEPAGAPVGVNKPRRVRTPVRNEPELAPPSEVLQRYNARVLDPTTAMVVAGQTPIRPTVYIAHRLIVSGAADQTTQGALQEAARRFGLALILDEKGRGPRAPEVARAAQFPADQLFVRLRLVPASGAPTPAPDAWPVLQTFRTLLARESPGLHQVALDHLLTATADIGGTPFITSHGIGGTPFITSHGYASYQYGTAGAGGRQPVNWLGALPQRTANRDRRRPVVAVLDTGAGAHPWLPPDLCRVESIIAASFENSETSGVTADPYEGVLDPDSGHGTFIAGLIRQHCPDADILAVPIYGGDGVVAESDLLDAVWLLFLRHLKAVATGDGANVIDVLSLSLGYYHEQPDDTTFDAELLKPLRQLGTHGVVVVAAAGNDSTDRPMFPAAFTPWAGGPVKSTDAKTVPLISVGALNPNRTVALFSNAGDWVACHRPGAALVSTLPTTFNGSEQPDYAVTIEGDGHRATIDPDDFGGGFGVWSGTSFAAPVLAGQLAAQLCTVDLNPIDQGSAVQRGWNAVQACVQGFGQ